MIGQLPVAPHCPGCGAKLDGYTTSDGTPMMPTDGDFSICIYCDSVGVFVGNAVTGTFTIRRASPAERDEAIADL